MTINQNTVGNFLTNHLQSCIMFDELCVGTSIINNVHFPIIKQRIVLYQFVYYQEPYDSKA